VAENETTRTSTGLAGVSRDLAVQNSEPTEAELERGIVDAVRLGLSDVARTLSAQLEDRRQARLPANVYGIDGGRRRPR
jgi:hypothetical protein